MTSESGGRRRAKISITVDPVLLSAVDLYVQRRQGLDRSKVMESALQSWYKVRQDKAMIEQFSDPNPTDERELHDWQHVRQAAARRILKRTGR